MTYVVNAPLIGVNGADGKLKMLYAGAPVPIDVSQDDIERLADGGLIVEVASDEPVKAAGRKAASNDGTA
ncbi:hypothetical protein [Rhodococcus sp. ARC_M6]|uniref:hypothetical protein n=1 Tax=Rhodococcus sp. ARC_M6 TaxID=2928852 RepID=UPI001FB49638|nr:hypothetical protein [Rhodococcus sp. ARC_M6]MCJ0906233.1 hypothetical protein [Rhodococcus sp. ARC_M6]